MNRLKVSGNLGDRVMKKCSYFVISAALLSAGCSVEMTAPEKEFSREVVLSAEVAEDETKSAIDASGHFCWTQGDKISVWTESETKGAFQTFTLNSGAGTSCATFRGIVVGEGMELSTCAVYPAGAHKLNGTTLTVNLPKVYNIGSVLSNTNAPMIAMLGYGETISFGHMAGLMTFSFKSVPAGVCSFVLTAADKDITGNFDVDLEGGLAVIEATPLTSNNTVTVNFAPLAKSQDITINVPMPVGTYNGMSYKLIDEAGNVVAESSSKAANKVARKKQIVMPSVKFHPSYGMPESLSANGIANCYVVSEKGYYNFRTKLAGDIFAGFHTNTLDIKPKSAKVLWDDVSGKDLITNVEFLDGYISFETDGTEGNAVIAAYDKEDPEASDAKILWSWHIWCTDAPEVIEVSNASGYVYEFMDRNLGAISADPSDAANTFGLVYQWGRKDPFLIVDKRDADVSLPFLSILDSVLKPEIFLKGNDWTSEPNDNLWGAIVSGGVTYYTKTIYDPCPAGYTVAPKDAMSGFDLADVTSAFDKGYSFPAIDADIWIPAGGYIIPTGSVRGNPTIYNDSQAYTGYYWNADSYVNADQTVKGAYYMKIADGEVKPVRTSSEQNRAFARSVRCIKK